MTHTLKAIWQAIVNVFYKPVKYSQYRERYKALDRLNDRDLWDMGITRGDIDDIAAGRFRKS